MISKLTVGKQLAYIQPSRNLCMLSVLLIDGRPTLRLLVLPIRELFCPQNPFSRQLYLLCVQPITT